MVETTTAVLDSLFQKIPFLLAGQNLKNGNKNMSYHVQQNTQQRSLGIFIVIAFHVLLIWALANGLGQRIICVLPISPVKVRSIDQKVTPPPPIDVPKPQIESTKINVDPNLPVISIAENAPQVIDHSGGGVEILPTVGISKPRLIKATKPEYPSAASRLGEEGTTGLKLFVTANGRVAEASVFSSSGSTRLDDAAIKHALRNWAFTPCMEGDKAVACWHKANLVWQLKDAR